MASVPLRLARAGQCNPKGFPADPVPAGQIVQLIVENLTPEDAELQRGSLLPAGASAATWQLAQIWYHALFSSRVA